MRTLIALAVFALAAACTPAPPPAAVDPAEAPAAEPTPDAPSSAAIPISDEASCATAGGDWRPICRMQKPACVITYPDADKACSDGDDCVGDCLGAVTGAADAGQPATGVCSTSSDPCGCKTRIEDGKATATLCID
jgi:hypothetical protein